MLASYGASLAKRMNRDIQKVMDTPAYMQIFPDVALPGQIRPDGRRSSHRGTHVRTGDEFEVVNWRGAMRAAGVGGGMTGRPFDFGIMDDLLKDRKEAESPVIRGNIDDWYQSVFRARKKSDQSRMIFMMTAWHHDDQGGRLIRRMKDSPLADQWTVIKFPAILDEPNPIDPRQIGQALWEDRHSLASMLQTKASTDPFVWSSVYQQQPTPREGSLFAEASFQKFRTERKHGRLWILMGGDSDGRGANRVAADRCIWFQTVDTASTTKTQSDYTVVGTFGVTPSGHLLIWNIWRARLPVPVQFPAMKLLRKGKMLRWDRVGQNYKDWSASPPLAWPFRLAFTAIEPKDSGIGLLQLGAISGYPFKSLKVDGNKVQRAAPLATMYQNGMVWHHADCDEWIHEYVAELLKFPAAVHDDMVDVAGYAAKVSMEDQLVRAFFTADAKSYVAESLSMENDGVKAEIILSDEIIDIVDSKPIVELS